MMPNPIKKYIKEPKVIVKKYFMMILIEFFALVEPVSTKVKPACMKNTRNVPNITHTKLIEAYNDSKVIEIIPFTSFSIRSLRSRVLSYGSEWHHRQVG